MKAQLLEWVTPDRIASYISLAVAVHAAALAFVNLTPTPKDNRRLGKVSRAVVRTYRIIELAAGIVTRKAKQ
jgi:hypothetical protein